MEAWKRFGDFVGRHYAAVSPVLVILAVIFPDVFSQLRPLVPAMFAIITFQGSLGNDFNTLADAFSHPRDMLIILALSSIAMPLLSFLLGSLVFGGNQNLVTGIVLEYCVPVAVVSTMWIGMYDGDPSLGLATLLVSTVLSPFTIPLTLKVLLGATVEVDALGMVRSMIVQIAIPALAGTAVNHTGRGWGKRGLSPVLAPATKVMLLLVILANSTTAAPYMRDLSPEHLGAVIFIGVFSACGFVLGLAVAHLLRRDRARTVTMTFQTGLRNISAGTVLAAQYFPGEVMLPVTAGTLFQQILAAFAGKLIDRVWEDGRRE
jgi:predicted Na+-dependent transporter